MEKISIKNKHINKKGEYAYFNLLLKYHTNIFMDINQMRNIVILKNLPSNLIEEAFIVLKKNQKIKKMEYAETKSDAFSDAREQGENAYVVKEAEMLISDYIKKIETQDLTGKKNEQILLRKYKKLKIFSLILVISLVISYIAFLN